MGELVVGKRGKYSYIIYFLKNAKLYHFRATVSTSSVVKSHRENRYAFDMQDCAL